MIEIEKPTKNVLPVLKEKYRDVKLVTSKDTNADLDGLSRKKTGRNSGRSTYMKSTKAPSGVPAPYPPTPTARRGITREAAPCLPRPTRQEASPSYLRGLDGGVVGIVVSARTRPDGTEISI